MFKNILSMYIHLLLVIKKKKKKSKGVEFAVPSAKNFNLQSTIYNFFSHLAFHSSLV